MKILLMRGWEYLQYAATFATIEQRGVGGTEFQLLQHARALRKLGHQVRVLGVVREDCVQEGVSFLGADGRADSLRRIREDCGDTDVVFTNAKHDLASLRHALPAAVIIEVCQNGPHFENDASIDLYACVGAGQFAYYAVKFPEYRSKFVLMPSVPPWKTVYSTIEPVAKSEQIVWVGSVQKQGLRRWAKAMSVLMKERKLLRWTLCVPSYDLVADLRSIDVLCGIHLPTDRVVLKNLSIRELAREIARSKIQLASLGGEDGPVAYLDGHAAGVPVLCGDDIYGKYSNPDGTGFRCTTSDECLETMRFLLQNAEVCRRMGEMGQKWIAENLTEDHQLSAIEQILAFVVLKRDGLPMKGTVQSDRKFSLRYWRERFEIKVTRLRGLRHG